DTHSNGPHCSGKPQGLLFRESPSKYGKLSLAVHTPLAKQNGGILNGSRLLDPGEPSTFILSGVF
ncbi:MAG: hypothetical protein ACE5FZ_06035, partial [Nitrospiria bacterium]